MPVPTAGWQQLSLKLGRAAAARAETLLELAGAAALSLDDAGDEPVLEPPAGSTPLWPVVVIRALFPAEVNVAARAAALAAACGAELVGITLLDDADWQAAARRAPTERAIGNRLWLSDAHAGASAAPGRAHVRLHMGLAFGTGEHATTALCLEWLDANLATAARVLDYGCGSGILGIAALALGASAAWAVDVEEQALAATADNARLNGVAERLWIGRPAALPDVTADVILANILADPLAALAPALSARAVPDGALVLSGVTEQQESTVVRAYEPYCTDFRFAKRDGWVRIAARRAVENR